ncbi:Antiseptic resistance protein [anaerobic digester metagenome]
METSRESKIGWTSLLIVSLSSFIIALDSTFMNVAITNLVVDLNTTVHVIQTIISVYALTMAALMLIGGKMQDVLGKKRAFLIGACIYGTGTVIAALSVNSTMLLIGWSILEGVGAALMTPATASIITGTYTGKDRAFALGIWTAMAGVAAAIGPLFGGFLTTFFSWRWGFALELVVIAVILIFSPKINNFPATMKISEIDVVGGILSASGLLLIVLGILSLNQPSNWKMTPFLIGGGILFMALFYIKEKNMIKEDKKPLTDIRLFKERNFTIGTLTRLIMQMALAGAVFVMPIFLQGVLGADAFTTGLVLLPLTVGLLIFSVTSSRLSSHVEPRRLISVGFLVAMAGALIMRYQFSLNTQIVDLLPGTFLIGVGLGLSIPLTANLILSSAGEDEQADASGVMSTGANLGSSMGTAIIGVVLIIGIFTGLSTAVEQNFPNEYSKQDIKDNLVTWAGKMKTVNIPDLKKDETSTAYKIVNSTISKAMQTAFDATTLLMFLGFLISLFLRPAPSGRVS